MLNVAGVSVAMSIGSLNVTTALATSATLVAPFNGTTAVTRGGVTSTVRTVAAAVSPDCSERTPDVQFADTV